jgi:hypothetical protein
MDIDKLSLSKVIGISLLIAFCVGVVELSVTGDYRSLIYLALVGVVGFIFFVWDFVLISAKDNTEENLKKLKKIYIKDDFYDDENDLDSIFEIPGQIKTIIDSAYKKRDKNHPNKHTVIKCGVAGVKHYTDNVELLLQSLEGDKYFGLSDDQIRNVHYKFYEYCLSGINVELVPEPTNSFDKNAILVLINGFSVGHIPSDKCLKVLRRIELGYESYWTIFGGRYKEGGYDKIIQGIENYYIQLKLFKAS